MFLHLMLLSYSNVFLIFTIFMIKNHFFFVLLLVLSFTLPSCQDDVVDRLVVPTDSSSNTLSKSFLKMDVSVNAQKDLLAELLSVGTLRSLSEGVPEEDQIQVMSELTDLLIQPATELLGILSFTDDELVDLFGKRSIAEITDADIVGLALFSYSYGVAFGVDGIPALRSSSVTDCFLEATSIAAGVGIMGELAKGTLSKAAVKQAIKMAAKLGGRTLSGIGLALTAAEFTWCMLR